MNDILIRFAQVEDIYNIKKLIDENISRDYFSLEYISNIINMDNHFIVVATDENNDVVAMIYCMIDTLKKACDIAYIPRNISPLNKYDDDQIVCLYKTTCTRKDNRNNGILSSFMTKMDSIIREKSFDFSIVLALILPSGIIPAHNILEKSGFVKCERVSKPWIHIKSYCDYCKNNYCTCDGMFYIKE